MHQDSGESQSIATTRDALQATTQIAEDNAQESQVDQQHQAVASLAIRLKHCLSFDQFKYTNPLLSSKPSMRAAEGKFQGLCQAFCGLIALLGEEDPIIQDMISRINPICKIIRTHNIASIKLPDDAIIIIRLDQSYTKIKLEQYHFKLKPELLQSPELNTIYIAVNDLGRFIYTMQTADGTIVTDRILSCMAAKIKHPDYGKLNKNGIKLQDNKLTQETLQEILDNPLNKQNILNEIANMGYMSHVEYYLKVGDHALEKLTVDRTYMNKLFNPTYSEALEYLSAGMQQDSELILTADINGYYGTIFLDTLGRHMVELARQRNYFAELPQHDIEAIEKLSLRGHIYNLISISEWMFAAFYQMLPADNLLSSAEQEKLLIDDGYGCNQINQSLLEQVFAKIEPNQYIELVFIKFKTIAFISSLDKSHATLIYKSIRDNQTYYTLFDPAKGFDRTNSIKELSDKINNLIDKLYMRQEGKLWLIDLKKFLLDRNKELAHNINTLSQTRKMHRPK